MHDEAHLTAGAKKMLFSHHGINHEILRIRHYITFSTSFTTNFVIPIIKILDELFGIETGTISTI